MIRSLINSSRVTALLGDQAFAAVCRELNNLLAGMVSSGVIIFKVSSAVTPLVTTRKKSVLNS
ncbi:hypothetical protein D3C73_1366160 [compost metagenome]